MERETQQKIKIHFIMLLEKGDFSEGLSCCKKNGICRYIE